MKDGSRRNIEIIKSHFFDDSDKITAGYIIGLAVEKTSEITDGEWLDAINSVLYENGVSGKSTSVSLRQEIFERITKIKDKLQNLCGKSLYMSQVIDIILIVIANKLSSNLLNLNGSLTLAHSQNSQMSFMYGFFFVKFLFFTVVCVVIVI